MPGWGWLLNPLKKAGSIAGGRPNARTPAFNPAAGLEPTNDMAISAPLKDTALPVMPNIGLPERDEITGARIPYPRAVAGPEPLTGGGAAAPEAISPVEFERAQVPIPALPGRSSGPRPFDPIRAAEYDYVRARPNSDTVQGIGGRLKSGLKPALLGFLQAAARDRENPLAAGAGGAIAGFGLGAIDPTMGREYEFDVMERPAMEAAAAQERAQRAEALDTRYKTAQIGDLEGRSEDRKVGNEIRRQKATADAKLAQARVDQDQWFPVQGGVVNRRDGTFRPNPYAPKPAEKARAPIRVGNVLVDPVTFEEVYRGDAPGKPMTARDAYDEVLAEDGSIEQIAQDSLQGRLETLKGQLSPRERDILEGRASDAFDSEIVAAKQRWQEIQQKELMNIRRDTESRAKAKAATKRKGKSSANTSTAPRNVDDLMNLLK